MDADDCPISQDAIDLIVAEEVSSEAVYKKRYTRPEWPGGASGVTIGIGYDCGYATPAQIKADWGPHLPDEMVAALLSVAGCKGAAGRLALPKARSRVNVPWDAAMAVFMEKDVPKWTNTVRKALPNCELLSKDCLGALVSLAYNRGPSFSAAGDRYKEMRAIKASMAAKRFDEIPGHIRAMKRIWKTASMRGLVTRREHEAELFERGLAAIEDVPFKIPAADPEKPTPMKPKDLVKVSRKASWVSRLLKAFHAIWASFTLAGVLEYFGVAKETIDSIGQVIQNNAVALAIGGAVLAALALKYVLSLMAEDVNEGRYTPSGESAGSS